MGQPSFQASNAIIYLTYGAFLYVRPHLLPHLWLRTRMLITNAFGMQGLGLIRCLVLETSVQVRIPGYKSNTEGLGSARA